MKLKTRIKKNIAFNIAGLILWAIALTVLSLCFTAKGESGSFGVLLSYFTKPSVFVVNFIPVLLVTLFFGFATNKMWITYLTSAFIIMAMTLVNYFKIMLRDDPFVAADFGLLSEAINIGERYTFSLDIFFIAAMAVVAAGIIISKQLFKYRIKKPSVRICGAIASIAILVILIKPVYFNETLYTKLENIDANPYMNKLTKNDQFASRGFIYSFLHSISDIFETPPAAYSEEFAENALAQYSYDNIPDDKKVNIISVMLESFNDFSKFESIEFSNNPYTYLYELRRKSVWGNVFTNIFGGGTINSERSFITGYSTQTEYRKPTNSYAHYLRQQGYTVEGGHPGHEWFYNRDLVNKFLGFENYKFFETGYGDIYNNHPNKGDGILDDQYLFEEILDRFEANKGTGKPYFNFSVSYQNHGPYNTTALNNSMEYVKKTDQMSDEAYYIINNYLAGIEKTLQAVENLVNQLDNTNEPVMLVLFGDHNPWLGNDSFVYNELGINLDFAVGDGIYNYFAMPYIIYANDAAKTMTGSSVSGHGGDFGIMYLMNKIFDINGWTGNEFMKASNDLRKKLDIVTNIGLCRENGEMTPNISKDAFHELEKFRIVQYYWRNEIDPEKISAFTNASAKQ